MMKKVTLFTFIAFWVLCVKAQNWEETTKIVASDRVANGSFGSTVSISGEYAIAGAYNSSGADGNAFIFKKNGDAWEQVQKLSPSDASAGLNYYFGKSVAVSGDYAIVGDPFKTVDGKFAAGCAYVFENNNGTWEEMAILTASDFNNGQFGCSVSISGNYAVIGAYTTETDANGENPVEGAGAAYIFYNNNGTWEQVQKIAGTERAYNYYFGNDVSISGDYIVVGSYVDGTDENGENNIRGAGSAYIFKNNEGNWDLVQKIVAPVRNNSGESFTKGALFIAGDYIIAGALNDSEDENEENMIYRTGSAYIFKNNNGTWEVEQKLVASDRTLQDAFGSSVSLSGNYAIIGAIGDAEDANGENEMTNAGSAYIFKNNNGTWEQQSKISASDRSSNDYFGASVAMYMNHAIVGAYHDGDDANGENPVVAAGSAYMIEFNGPVGEITNQPADQLNVCLNSTAGFKVVANNIASYQWQVNEGSGFTDVSDGDVYSGTTTDSLGVKSVTASMSGYQYRCLLSHDFGILESNTVNLISDAEAPVITSTLDDVQLNASANCEGVLPDYTVDIVATDNCTKELVITQSPVAGTVVNGSENAVTITVADAAGNESSTMFNVTVGDFGGPVVTSDLSNKVVESVENCQAVLADYTAGITAADNCSTVETITQSPAAGTAISGSYNTVTITLTDGNGNTSDTTFNVAVEDNTAPVISSTHADKALDAVENCEASLPDYTGDIQATDNCDTELTITQSPVAGTMVSGTTNQVTITVSDGLGNVSDVSFNVSVEDNTAPLITSTHIDVTVDAGDNCTASLPDYTGDIVGTDNCSSTFTISQSPEAATAISSTTEVTLTVTDEAGNSTFVTFNARVEDNTAPVITSTNNDVTLTGDANGEISLPDYTADVNATDNCDTDLEITQSPAAGTAISGDDNTVTLAVTDDSGNETQATFNVDVDIADGIISLEEKGLSIYPNPTRGVFFVEEGQTNIQSITVSDYTGKMVLTMSGEQAKSGIDLQDLNGKLFIVTIRASEGVAVVKVVKE